MALYQILYWQDIPSQVKAWDDFDETKVELGPKFVALIDQTAQSQGLTGTDDYLSKWRWGDELEREGTAQEVAEALKKELEAGKRGVGYRQHEDDLAVIIASPTPTFPSL